MWLVVLVLLVIMGIILWMQQRSIASMTREVSLLSQKLCMPPSLGGFLFYMFVGNALIFSGVALYTLFQMIARNTCSMLPHEVYMLFTVGNPFGDSFYIISFVAGLLLCLFAKNAVVLSPIDSKNLLCALAACLLVRVGTFAVLLLPSSALRISCCALAVLLLLSGIIHGLRRFLFVAQLSFGRAVQAFVRFCGRDVLACISLAFLFVLCSYLLGFVMGGEIIMVLFPMFLWVLMWMFPFLIGAWAFMLKQYALFFGAILGFTLLQDFIGGVLVCCNMNVCLFKVPQWYVMRMPFAFLVAAVMVDGFCRKKLMWIHGIVLCVLFVIYTIAMAEFLTKYDAPACSRHWLSSIIFPVR